MKVRDSKLAELQREAKSMPIAVIVSEIRTGKIIAVNQYTLNLLGYRNEKTLVGKSVRDITHEAFRDEVDASYSIIKAQSSYQIIKRYVKADGSDFLGHLHAQSHFAYPDIAVAVIVDLDETRELTQATLKSNNLDQLTGVLRRELLLELVHEQHLGQQKQAIYFIDLNHFKVVNDRYGHSIGDAVLVSVANRLKAVMRGRGFVVRYGGDEFVAIANDISETEVENLANELDIACASPVKAIPNIEMSACIGVVVNNGRSSAKDIIDQADSAMYSAKQNYMKGASRINILPIKTYH